MAEATQYVDSQIGDAFPPDQRLEMVRMVTQAIYISNMHPKKRGDRTYVLQYMSGYVDKFKNALNVVFLSAILDLRIQGQAPAKSRRMETVLQEFMTENPSGAEFLTHMYTALHVTSDRTPTSVVNMGLTLTSDFLTDFKMENVKSVNYHTARLSDRAVEILSDADHPENFWKEHVKYKIPNRNYDPKLRTAPKPPISEVRSILFDMFYIAVFSKMPNAKVKAADAEREKVTKAQERETQKAERERNQAVKKRQRKSSQKEPSKRAKRGGQKDARLRADEHPVSSEPEEALPRRSTPRTAKGKSNKKQDESEEESEPSGAESSKDSEAEEASSSGAEEASEDEEENNDSEDETEDEGESEEVR